MPASSWSDVVRELKLPETPETILQACLRLKAEGHLREALSGLEEVMRRDERHVTALREMTGVLRQLARPREAEAVERRRIAAEADQIFLLALQHIGEDGDVTQRYLAACTRLAPGHEGIGFIEALLGLAPPPARIPEAIVSMLADQQAARYDWHSRTVWRCQSPQLLFDAVAAEATETLQDLEMADIGCGTGLGAEPFAGRVMRIDGVDLAPQMVDRAFRRRLHDESSQPLYVDLEVDNFVAWLRRRVERYDLVLAADALESIGALEPVFVAATAALRPAGLLAFSYETSQEPGPSFSPRHGFRHNPFMVRRALSTAGLDILSHRQAVLRHDGNTPVQGGIVVACRRGDR